MFACPRRRELQFWTKGMTRKVQPDQAGILLFLSHFLAIVDEVGVQIRQTTNCVYSLCCVHVRERAVCVVCVLVLISDCWVEDQQ